MPRKDGSGPLGKGPAAGRGFGRKGGRGAEGAGPSGYCECPKCGETIAHLVGVPCTAMKCPQCGATMVRKS